MTTEIKEITTEELQLERNLLLSYLQHDDNVDILSRVLQVIYELRERTHKSN